MGFGANIQQRLRRLPSLAKRFGNAVPLTWRGVLVAVLSAAALYRYGYASLDLLLFVVGISGLVLTLLAMLTVGTAALLLRRSAREQLPIRQRLEAGSPIPTGYSLPSFEKIPLVRIHWRWQHPTEVDCRIRPRDGHLVEEVVATRRCLVHELRRRLEVFDAFGLAGVRWDQEEKNSLMVLPRIGRLRQMPVLQSLAATEGIAHPAGAPDGDRMEIRRYVPGDSIRHILWKTFAKTRQLNVRLPERSIHPEEKTVAYLLTGDHDEAAAAAARVALESGALGPQWLFGADGTPYPVDSLEEALRAIARSGSLPPSSSREPPGDLVSFLSHPQIAVERHCILFAPARPGRWTAAAIEASRHFAGSLSFVLATDGVAQPQPSTIWHRLLYFDPPDTATPAPELQAVSRTLNEAGFSTVVVDRESGRAHGREIHRPLGATG